MKKLVLVADVENWAFDIAAKIIKNALSDKLQIDIYYVKTVERQNDLFGLLEDLKDYDFIHFFWRAILINFESEEFKRKVIEKYSNFDEYVNKFVEKISTGVYDHLYENDIEFISTFTKYCSRYAVSSKKLFDTYSSIKGVKKPFGIVGDSFEKEKFFPLNMDRFNDSSKMVIGWAGNSEWNSNMGQDFKGFHTILKPVIEELQKEGYNIELYCADKATNKISNDDMCEYYSKIHIYTCVSYIEGTPKPLLEAMGCGVPIITTDVGVANEALGPKEHEYILGQRDIGKDESQMREKLKEKIKYLYNNRNILKELSEENYEYSKAYEIGCMKTKYEDFFLR